MKLNQQLKQELDLLSPEAKSVFKQIILGKSGVKGVESYEKLTLDELVSDMDDGQQILFSQNLMQRRTQQPPTQDGGAETSKTLQSSNLIPIEDFEDQMIYVVRDLVQYKAVNVTKETIYDIITQNFDQETYETALVIINVINLYLMKGMKKSDVVYKYVQRKNIVYVSCKRFLSVIVNKPFNSSMLDDADLTEVDEIYFITSRKQQKVIVDFGNILVIADSKVQMKTQKQNLKRKFVMFDQALFLQSPIQPEWVTYPIVHDKISLYEGQYIDNKFPVILKNDPLAKLLQLQEGQILEINTIRSNGCPYIEKQYRYVGKYTGAKAQKQKVEDKKQDTNNDDDENENENEDGVVDEQSSSSPSESEDSIPDEHDEEDEPDFENNEFEDS